MRTALISVALAVASMATGRVEAQDPDTGRVAVRAGDMLSREMAERVAAWYNEPAAMRVSGRLEIATGQTVTGNVAVLYGPVSIAGRVTGRVVIVNGDATLAPSARVDGDLVLVGGHLQRADAATVGGEISWYRPSLVFHHEGEIIVAERDQSLGAEGEGWFDRWRRRRGSASSSKLHLRSAGAYNRVEGLAVYVGPSVRQRLGDARVHVEAYGVVRSSQHWAWESPNLGHRLRGEVRLGNGRFLAVGGQHHDIVDAVEPWQLRDTEVGLAAFFLRRDFRDYFGRHGARGYVSLGAGDALTITAGYGAERWHARDERDPFSLFRGDQRWRPNPPLDEGRLRLTNATVVYDTREDVDDPWSGWYVVADLEHGRTDRLRLAAASPAARAPAGAAGPVRYTRGFVDLRRYNRMSPEGQLNFRLVAGGWLAGDELPLQRRLSVGGPGTLPGYDFRHPIGAADVGTCSGGHLLPGRPAQCERIALAQIEYRGELRIDVGDDEEEEGRGFWRDLRVNVHRRGQWIIFADAGRGWLLPNRDGGGGTAPPDLVYGTGRLPPPRTFRTDVGVGLDFDNVALLVAKSVSDSKKPANFLVRLRHRF